MTPTLPALAVAALAVLLLAAACADEGEAPWPMPGADAFPDDVLGREFEYRRSTPFDEPSLALQLPCRTDWKWVPVTSDTKGHHNRMVTLARVEAPGDPEVAIEMKYLLLREDVRLEDWVDYFLEVQGLTAVAGRSTVYHDRPTVDVVAEFREGERRFVGRLGFFKNADRVWLTAGTAPADRYARWAGEFAVAVTSATPSTLSSAEFAEPLTERRLAAPTPVAFAFPRSWECQELGQAPEGVAGVDLRRMDGARLRGLVKVRAYDRARLKEFRPEQATWSVFEEFKASWPSLEMREKRVELEASAEDFPGPGRMTVYGVEIAGVGAEVRELVLERPEAVVAVILVSFEPVQAPLGNLFNRRAWEIVGMKLRWQP